MTVIHGSGGGSLAWVSMVLAMVGITGLSVLGWMGRHPVAGRILTAILVACIVATGISAAAFFCCSGCDPDWIWLYLCL